MKTAKKISTNSRAEVIEQAVAFARPILGRRNRETLKRRWVVRWDSRRHAVYKATEVDDYCGRFGYLEHDGILELYTAYPKGDTIGWGWSCDYAGDTCQTEAELRSLITKRVEDADDRFFSQREIQIGG